MACEAVNILVYENPSWFLQLPKLLHFKDKKMGRERYVSIDVWRYHIASRMLLREVDMSFLKLPSDVVYGLSAARP